MKIVAIPVSGGMVNDHFGHSESFRVVGLNDRKEIVWQEDFSYMQGCGCKTTLAHDLHKKGVTTVLAGNIGQGAIKKMESEGIEVISGLSGSIDDAINSWRSGTYNSIQMVCNHDHQGEGCHTHSRFFG